MSFSEVSWKSVVSATNSVLLINIITVGSVIEFGKLLPAYVPFLTKLTRLAEIAEWVNKRISILIYWNDTNGKHVNYAVLVLIQVIYLE